MPLTVSLEKNMRLVKRNKFFPADTYPDKVISEIIQYAVIPNRELAKPVLYVVPINHLNECLMILNSLVDTPLHLSMTGRQLEQSTIVYDWPLIACWFLRDGLSSVTHFYSRFNLRTTGTPKNLNASWKSLPKRQSVS